MRRNFLNGNSYLAMMAWFSRNSPRGRFRNENHSPTVTHNMKKRNMTQTLLFILVIGIGLFYAIKYGNKAKKDIEKYQRTAKKTELKTFEEAELELENYTEEDRMIKLEFLKTNVYYGLENLNNGFDSESIYYFTESDFEILLDRVEKLGIGIMGIEPWLNGNFYGVKVVEDFYTVSTDSKWYRKAFEEFKKSGKQLQYAATYEIPKGKIK